MTHAGQFGLASSSSADLDDACHDTVRSGDPPRAMRQLGCIEHLRWLLDQHRPAHFAVTAHVSGRTDLAAADFAAVAFANELELTNLGSLPFGDTYGHPKLNNLWGPCVLPRFENMQVIGVATVNSPLCLV
jgi:hypothetical protein